MTITLDDLQAFIGAAELQNFGLAAEKLSLSQSALSRRIRKLEDALGAQLFDRTTRRVVISKVGKQFLPEARRIVENFDVSISNIKSHIQKRMGEVLFAVNNSIATSLLPDIIDRFRRDNRGISVRVYENSSSEVVEKVLSGEVEIGVSHFSDGHRELDFESIVDDRFVVICSHKHEIAQKKYMEWSDLRNYNFIHTRSDSGIHRKMERVLGEDFYLINGDVRVRYYRALPGLVMKNIGITVVPITLVPPDAERMGIVHIPIVNPVLTRSIGIVTPRLRSLSPAAEALRDVARVALKEKFSTELAAL